MGDTAFALGLFVMGNSRSLFALMACLETEKIQKMVFSDFDSLLCAPTVRIFKLEPVYTAGGCRAEKVLCAIKQNFCRRAVARQENLTWSGGKRPAWTAFCGCEYRFLICDPPNRTGPGCFQPGPVRLTAPAFFTAATPLPPTTGCATTQAYKTCLYGNGCKR